MATGKFPAHATQQCCHDRERSHPGSDSFIYHQECDKNQEAVLYRDVEKYHSSEDGETKTIDLLFVIANAPVGTLSLPKHGSEAYVGLATAMELAMNEISEEFPSFFAEESEPSGQCKR